MTQILKADTLVKVVIGPVVAVGDGFTPITTLSLSTADEAELIKHDAAAVTDISGNTFAAITSADGYYNLTITAAQLDTEGMLTVLANDDSLCLPVKATFMVVNANVYDSLYAVAETDVLDVNTVQVGATVQTAGDIPALVTTVDTVVDGIQTDLDNGTDGLGAIKADTASTQKVLGSGTARAGGTSTQLLLATAETFADDELDGTAINIVSGTGAGQTRLCTGNTNSTDIATVLPAWTTNPDATSLYEIVHGTVNVMQWQGVTPSGLSSGRIDATVGAMQTDVLNAAALATDAVNEVRDAMLSDSTAFAGAAITEARLAELDAANLPADVAGRATPAQVNTEVSDVLKTDTIAEMAQGVPTATPTFEEAVMYLYMALRNRLDVDTTATDFKEYYNDAGTVIWKKTLTDDGTIYSEAKGITGP